MKGSFNCTRYFFLASFVSCCACLCGKHLVLSGTEWYLFNICSSPMQQMCDSFFLRWLFSCILRCYVLTTLCGIRPQYYWNDCYSSAALVLLCISWSWYRTTFATCNISWHRVLDLGTFWGLLPSEKQTM